MHKREKLIKTLAQEIATARRELDIEHIHRRWRLATTLSATALMIMTGLYAAAIQERDQLRTELFHANQVETGRANWPSWFCDDGLIMTLGGEPVCPISTPI